MICLGRISRSPAASHRLEDQRTPLQAETWARNLELAGELQDADTSVRGLPLYTTNGAASSVKAWADHMVVPGVTRDPATFEDLLGGGLIRG